MANLIQMNPTQIASHLLWVTRISEAFEATPAITHLAELHIRQVISSLNQNPKSIYGRVGPINLSLACIPPIVCGWNYLTSPPEEQLFAWNVFMCSFAATAGSMTILLLSEWFHKGSSFPSDSKTADHIMRTMRQLEQEKDFPAITNKISNLARAFNILPSECKEFLFREAFLAQFADHLSMECELIFLKLLTQFPDIKNYPFFREFNNPLFQQKKPEETFKNVHNYTLEFCNVILTFDPNGQSDRAASWLRNLVIGLKTLWDYLPQDKKPDWRLPEQLLIAYRGAFSLGVPVNRPCLHMILLFIQDTLTYHRNDSSQQQIQILPPISGLLNNCLLKLPKNPRVRSLLSLMKDAEDQVLKKPDPVNHLSDLLEVTSLG